MLKARVITAVLLLAVLLPALFFLPQRGWALLAAAIAGIAGWEWGGLNRFGPRGRIAYGACLGLGCAALAILAPGLIDAETPNARDALPAYLLAAAFWVLIVPFWFKRKWRIETNWSGALVGLVVIVPTWLALVQLRIPGPAALLAVLAAVWVADIAAYFAGKAFGRHKLAPSISPGKTWEGAAGAGVGVVIYGLAVRQAFGIEGGALALWLPGLVLLTAISIAGDLFESLLKRQAGIKDSSNILPGHGGVLDRIDSLTSTLPVVALLWLLLSANPA